MGRGRLLRARAKDRMDCGRVLFGNCVAKREAEGTVHTKHQLNLDPIKKKPDRLLRFFRD